LAACFFPISPNWSPDQGDQMRFWKYRPKCGPIIISCQNDCITFAVEKSRPKIGLPTYVISRKPPNM
jgi:hypothetical protein